MFKVHLQDKLLKSNIDKSFLIWEMSDVKRPKRIDALQVFTNQEGGEQTQITHLVCAYS